MSFSETHEQRAEFAPMIVEPLRDQLAALGDSVELECSAIGQPAAAPLWLFGTQPLRTPSARISSELRPPCSFVLRISGLCESDAGTYALVLSNKLGARRVLCSAFTFTFLPYCSMQ